MNFGERIFVETNSQSASQREQELTYGLFLINQSVEAAFCLGANAEFLYVNNATCRMSEYSREELMSMTLLDLDVDFSLQDWSKQWRSLRRQGSLTYTSRYRTKGGRLFPVEINISYVEQLGKELICAFVKERGDRIQLVTDQQNAKLLNLEENLEQEVVEYQKTESQLATSLWVLRSTLDSTANGILAVNFEGEILCYNQKFMDMWQLPSSVGISKKCQRAKAFFESQVKDPELFRRAVWDMPSQLNTESYDLVELKDGRIFAHYSEPHRLGNKIIGRVWSSTLR